MKATTGKILRVMLVLLLVALLCPMGIVSAEDVQQLNCCKLCDMNGDGAFDEQDAYHLLYHFYETAEIDACQPTDINEDGVFDEQDAYELLYALFDDETPFGKEMIHQYSGPVWNWNMEDPQNPVVTATLRCGCGQGTLMYTNQAEGEVVLTSAEKTDATCTAAGSVTYKATLTVDGVDWESQESALVPAAGHSVANQTADCENDVSCTVCGTVVEKATGHKMVLNSDLSTEADCNSNAVNVYTCANGCGEQVEEEIQGTAGHIWKYLEGQDVAVGCQYTKQYQCQRCDAVQAGTAATDTYTKHTISADQIPEVTVQATCTTDGVLTYKCEKCGTVDHTDAIAHGPDFHKWGEADANGISTCGICGETKKTVAAENGAVNTDDLAADGSSVEVKLENNAAISLNPAAADTVKNNAGSGSITIVANPITVDQLGDVNLSQENIDKLNEQANGNLYDLRIVDENNNPVSFEAEGAEATVSLPYTLKEGDDVSNISIWYVNEDGELEEYKGTYSNGYVTFTTTHFSYYTVTRLTAAERCGRFGHVNVAIYKAPTCDEDGYEGTTCQRCGKTEKSVLPASGHRMIGSEPTCTTVGVKVCQNPGCTYKEETPATGHTWVETENVAATCTTPGKITSQCACGAEQVQTTEALGHELSTEITSAATCTAAGTATTTCTRCDYSSTVENELPLGHNYTFDPETDCTWTPSGSSMKVTLTLHCANEGCSQPEQTVNGEVTKYVKEIPCVGSYDVVYTAKGAYNGAAFVATYTVTKEGTGHVVASGFESDGSNHYRTCKNCGKKVDVAEHVWTDGSVIKEATCSESGTRNVTCDVCGHAATQAIPATGQHVYVDGVCSCGREEDTCDHEEKYVTEVDLSAYNLCEGATAVRIACECGEDERYEFTYGCDLIDLRDPVAVTDDNGNEIGTAYCSGCKVCGLTIDAVETYYTDEEACRSGYSVHYTHSLNGEVFCEYDMGVMGVSHPTAVQTETVFTKDEHGICGGTLYTYTCYCGQEQNCHWEETNCNFEWVYNGNVEVGTCTVCGLTETRTYSAEKNGCSITEHGRVVGTFVGQTLYETNSTYHWEEHNYKVTDYELRGDSCEDGISYTLFCEDCGEQQNYFDFYHVMTEEVRTDMSRAGTCFDAIVTETCACGQETHTWLTYPGESCDFWNNTVESGEFYQVLQCSTCGTTRREDYSYGPKGDGCMSLVSVTYTYADAKGNVLVSYVQDQGYVDRHEWQEETILLGDSCEDGVQTLRTCQDCGATNEYTYYEHRGFVVDEIQFNEEGLCCTGAIIFECACGQDKWLHLDGQGCEWEWISGEGNENGRTEVERCRSCGLTWVRQMQNGEAIDDCHILVKRIDTFTVTDEAGNENVLGQLTYDFAGDAHSWQETATLLPGSTTCEDGVLISRYCVNCGEQDSWETDHHYNAETREVISEGQLCGKIVRCIGACACGEYTYDEYVWEGDSWEFEYMGYDEQTGIEIYQCRNCGAERHEKYLCTRVEGETCKYNTGWLYVFYKDGQELVRYNDSDVTLSHASVSTTFNLHGTTCRDGYDYTETCAACGQVNEGTCLAGSPCNEWMTIETRLLYDAPCGAITMRTRGCACGDTRITQTDDWCTWDNGYDAELGKYVFTCSECGTKEYVDNSTKRIPGSCRGNRTITVMVWDADGNEVVNETGSYDYTEHVYVYDLSGLTCNNNGEEMYFRGACTYCGKTQTQYGYPGEHAVWMTEYYSLVDLGACYGEVRVYACPCGEENYTEYYYNCDLDYSVSETDPVTGRIHQVATCRNCGMVYEEYRLEEPIPGTCKVQVTRSLTFNCNGTVIQIPEFTQEWDEHDYVATGTLVDGATSCTDGAVITRTCRICGDSYSYNVEWHETFETGRFDLDQCGSVCGAELILTGCACGESAYYYFSDDTKCDLNVPTYLNSEDYWVDNVIEYKWSETSEGGHLIRSEFAHFFCPVDGCSLKLRYARYWTVENCAATEYMSWEYFDAETETWIPLVETHPTGNRTMSHKYEVTSYREDTENGWLDYYVETCVDCQSTQKRISTFDSNDRLTKSETIAENNSAYLESLGFGKRHYEVVEYQYADDYQMISRYYEEYMNADGSAPLRWYEDLRSNYRVVPGEGCYMDSLYKDMNDPEGTFTENVGACHHNWTVIDSRNPTCSQPGWYIEQIVCPYCNTAKNEPNLCHQDPQGHYFSWNIDLETYVCANCDLESTNGGNGSIVLEEIKTGATTDVDYVIGYWNSQNMDFYPQLSLILDTPMEDGNNELFITGVLFNWTTYEPDHTSIQTVTFDKAATQTAAEVALADAGYTGTYSIRITFVPVNSVDELDYSITLDPQTYSGVTE